jgi:hypothetical protein
MSDLRAQLEAALGGAYTVERELGGGGMSRVFEFPTLASAPLPLESPDCGVIEG